MIQWLVQKGVKKHKHYYLKDIFVSLLFLSEKVLCTWPFSSFSGQQWKKKKKISDNKMSKSNENERKRFTTTTTKTLWLLIVIVFDKLKFTQKKKKKKPSLNPKKPQAIN